VDNPVENYIDVINKEVSTPGVNGHMRKLRGHSAPTAVLSFGVSQDSHKRFSCMAIDVGLSS